MTNKLERKTKAELLEIITSQMSTIKSKDHDITQLSAQLNKAQTKLEKEDVSDKSQIRITAMKEQHEKEIERIKAQSEATFRKQNEHIKRREEELNELLGAHGDLLKTLQGISDMGVRYNSYIYKRVMKKQENKS